MRLGLAILALPVSAGLALAQTSADWVIFGTAQEVVLQTCDAQGQCIGLHCRAADAGNPRLTADLATTGTLPPAQATLRVEVDGQAFDATFYGDMAEDGGPIQPYLSDLMPLSPNPFLDVLASGTTLRIPPSGSFAGAAVQLDGLKHGLAAFRPACGAFAASPLHVAPVPEASDEDEDAAYRVLFEEVTARGQAVCQGGKAVISDEAFIPQPDGTLEVNTGFLECSLPGLTFPYCGATGYCAVWTYALQSGRYVLVREDLRRG